MSDIFTSYSRRDTEIVNKFVTVLTQAGLKVWIDREDILAGNSWRLQIVDAIDTCDAFVLMLSSNSAISINVQKEVILAQDSGRGIFVVMLEPVKPPAEMRYQLAGLQFIDLQALGFDKASAQLISAVKEHLKKIKPAGDGSQHQAELVIQGIDISAFTAEKQQQLLAFISNLANTDQSQLKIASMAAGSVHVFVDMPTATAFQLKTAALNRDKRFKEIGVTALKLAGDAYYINIALGILTPAAKTSPLNALWLRIPSLFSSIFGLATGKLLTILSALVVIAGLGIFASSLTPSLPAPVPTFTSTLASLPAETAAITQTFTPIPTLTSSATPTSTPTAEDTSTPTITPLPTSSPTPVYGFLDGVVIRTNDRIACRYGPGDPYLYKFEPISGNKIKVYGKMEIYKGDTPQVWLYGTLLGYESPCWVNNKYIQLNGDVSSLEPYYPDKAPLLLFHHQNFPPPKDVSATRDGDQVSISWTGYTLALGDRESANSPVYLVEAWTCQSGKIVFTPIGAYEEFASVKDEAGCSEPSHGQVFVAHKDGYVGPVEIPWP